MTFQTKLKWVGDPILVQGKKKYYEAVMLNDEKVSYFNTHFALLAILYNNICSFLLQFSEERNSYNSMFSLCLRT